MSDKRINIEYLDHVAITVKDLSRSSEWYIKVLGLEPRYPDVDVPVVLCSGETGIALFPLTENVNTINNPTKRDDPSMISHFAFKVDNESFEYAKEKLNTLGIEFKFYDFEFARSLFFFDPDGYCVELVTYES